MLRFDCSELVIEHLDPLVNPGQNPSAHMHQIVGGNSFSASMPSADISRLSTCTTCHFTQDLSNYWTANLYFQSPSNSSYRRVPQMANQFNDCDNAGITLYYTSAGANVTTAFQPGFRMLAGDVTRRISEGLERGKWQQCYRCFTKDGFGGSMYPPCMDPVWDTDHLPTGRCEGGIRTNVVFPQCWDGKNLDSPNHRDHVAHPMGGPAGFPVVSGKCPETHPVKIPQLMLEVTWDTRLFNEDEEWKEGRRFIGYGQHADYVFGWEGDSLQRAMDGGCYLRNCSVLDSQMPEVKNKCNVPITAAENIDGWMDQLSGGGEGM
ncbi:hypothetical protein GE09DRAFT_1176892 [Coniochaeta sp. 2T2.1]|nr:hypothetical protein GE09DRAFT_1176892 [Coniochaeta sp. 2T2.1]